MRFPSRHPAVAELPGVAGTVRMDHRTSSLVRRLRPGDIAVIDHLDLDRTSAEALIDSGVVAVVNAAPFISGRFPNLGPELLTSAGIALVDDVGPTVFSRLRDGRPARVLDGAVLVGEEEVVSGRSLDATRVAALMEEARSGLASQLQSFTHNTSEFLRRDQDLLLHGRGVPELTTRIDGRAVVVVVRGYHYREDLRGLRRFVREQRPVLVGVDAGADALLAAGHRPDIVVVGEAGLARGTTRTTGTTTTTGTTRTTGGEQVNTVSDRALSQAREVVLHADGTGRSVGSERLDRLGLRHRTLSASGTSEDVALLLADVRGASLIVAVGSHATLEEFLDRQRAGQASTFLTRLRVGPKLVDAKGVPALYAGRVRLWQLLLVLLAGLLAVGVAVAATPVGDQWWTSSLRPALTAVRHWARGLVP